MEQSKPKNNQPTIVPVTKIGLINTSPQGVLCLDLGTKTGWAFQSINGLVTSGTAEFKNDRWQGGGMRFLKFSHFLTDLYNHQKITTVYFEEVRRHRGVDAAHVYGGLMAHLTAWCECHNIAYEGVPVKTIKKFITGNGNANKQKVIDAVTQLGHTPADDNAADALAILHWARDNRKVGTV